MELLFGLLEGVKLFWRPFMIFSLLQALIFMCVKDKFFQSKPAEEMPEQEIKLKTPMYLLSIILNWILAIELLALNLIAVASIQANVMLMFFMFMGFGITFGLPFVLLFMILLSIKRRRNGRVLSSIIIQIIALCVAAVPIVWLFG